ncbi:MAG: hypothetical protein WAN04_11620 [Candidatus Udaeobacter sp.]
MIPGSARNWIGVNAVQQSSLNKNQTKNDDISTTKKNQSVRSPLGHGLLLIPLVLVCFGISPIAQAADRDLVNGNMSEGSIALQLALTTGDA